MVGDLVYDGIVTSDAMRSDFHILGLVLVRRVLRIVVICVQR